METKALSLEEQAAERILSEFNITKDKLPVNIDEILVKKGFAVSERELPENLAAVLDTRDTHKPILLIDKNQSDDKKRFVKACELGHFLLDTDFSGVRMDKKNLLVNSLSGTNANENDRRADRFAYALLMQKKLLEEKMRESAGVTTTSLRVTRHAVRRKRDDDYRRADSVRDFRGKEEVTINRFTPSAV